MWSQYLLAVPALAAVAQASAINVVREVDLLSVRAEPNSPNGYTPTTVTCPATPPSVRDASVLSQNETDWLQKRRTIALPAMQSFLSRVNISGFDVDAYFTAHASNISQLPNLATAYSGGGWRALMNGAGAIAAFDSRTENSTSAGHVGGVLQASTYIAGLSGGSWLVGSIYMNNFSTVPALQYSGDVWEFQNSILEGPPSAGIQLFDTVGYYHSLETAVSGKSDAGFDTSLTDYWARALSFQLINDTNGGPAYTWSSIAVSDNFVNAEVPMPIIIADERFPGEELIPSNTTIYEMNPFEFGSFDPTIFGFVPMQYLGTNFSAGSVSNTSSCVVGFDNAGYLMGTSSSLFNQIILQGTSDSSGLPSFLVTAIEAIANATDLNDDDIANYRPNPFYNYNTDKNPNGNETTLTLVDGGEDLENIPLHPLIQPIRNIDVIVAIDSSADTDTHWPNGTSLVATYERSLAASMANGTSFPSIPDVNTFVNLGLNTRPTFFGCNASNTTNPTPLIVYLPNAPYTYHSNVSTFQLSYEVDQRNSIIGNGYNVATMGNGTADSEWPACLACAMLSRSFDRTATTVPSACSSCYSRYCWDGSTNSTVPSLYEPQLKLNSTASASATSAAAGSIMQLSNPVLLAGVAMVGTSMLMF